MEFLDKARNAAARFMYGRNGMDSLNFAMLWGYVALTVLRMIVDAVTRRAVFGSLLGALYSVLAVALIFRAFSRNLPKRQEENRLWRQWSGKALSWTGRLRARGAGAAARLRDREHRYFTCKDCGTMCRVPAGKGKIVITCPHCGAKIQAKT